MRVMKTMSKYKIILADDHDILRTGLKELINKEPTFEVVAEAGDGEELLDKLKFVKCDLIVLDLSMPELDGMVALKEIKKTYSKIKVIILTMQKDQEQFKQAMAHGALGYLHKADAYSQLLLAMKCVLKGGQFISPKIAQTIAEQTIRNVNDEGIPSLEIFTKKEKEVLKLLAKGLAGKNIASELNISIRTVETHRFNLTNKLGIKTTAGLTQYAISKALI